MIVSYFHFNLLKLDIFPFCLVHRKQNDPQPKRKPLAITNGQSSNASGNDGHTVHNPLPRISAFLRRKSESYLSRRRSDESHFNRQSITTDSSLIHPKEIKEEERRDQMTHCDLVKTKPEFL